MDLLCARPSEIDSVGLVGVRAANTGPVYSFSVRWPREAVREDVKLSGGELSPARAWSSIVAEERV